MHGIYYLLCCYIVIEKRLGLFMYYCVYFSQSINELKPQVDDLSRSSNNVYNYVNSISNSLRERQRLVNGEKDPKILMV